MTKYISMSAIYLMFYMIGNVTADKNQDQLNLAIKCYRQFFNHGIIKGSGDYNNQSFKIILDFFYDQYINSYGYNTFYTTLQNDPESVITSFFNCFISLNDIQSEMERLSELENENYEEPFNSFFRNFGTQNHITPSGFCNNYRKLQNSGP